MKNLHQKLLFLCSLLFLCIISTSAWAVQYTGSLDGTTGSLMVNGGWENEDPKFSWVVNDVQNPGLWTYNYSWSTNIKDLSHLNIEVSMGLAFEEIISDWNSFQPVQVDSSSSNTPQTDGPDYFGTEGEDIYSIKWDLVQDSTNFDLRVVSYRSPMWGDIYAKGGDTYAFNNGFGIDPNSQINDGNLYTGANTGWALVPDTQTTTPVPEPSTMLLLGVGLLGLVRFAGKKLFKK